MNIRGYMKLVLIINKILLLTYTPIMLICILQNHPLDGMVLRLVFGIKIPQIILKS